MTIGIPRAGLYYLYYPFWQTFLTSLGFKVVLSPQTDRPILDAGLRIANSEACLPVKVMYGHVIWLKENADLILIPQMDEVKWGEMAIGTNNYFCPYFVGMPDVMKAEFPDLKILRPKMSFHDLAIEPAPWLALAAELGKSEAEAKAAFAAAKAAQCQFKEKQEKEKQTPLALLAGRTDALVAAKGQVALIGRPYIVYDESANLNLIGKIKSHGYAVVTSEMLSWPQLSAAIKVLAPERLSHWQLTNEEYGAILHYSQDPQVKGIIYLTPFNCGPDFIIEDFVISGVRPKKPVSVISIDESTGEAGLATRLEAFFDMIEYKQRVMSNE